jgi:N-acyl-D-amino-acid deacylase
MTDMYDLLIRGGTIVDGTGQPPFQADIAIRNGRIVALKKRSAAAAEEIDATGKIVTPGFVDVHTHYDGQITWEHTLAPSSDHGVTTVVMGNCGVGFAPVRPGDHQLVIKLMEGVEDIPDAVMAEGVPWNWESFPDYLDALEQRHADIDFAAQLPHSPLRVYVMGERGANLEPPTEQDLIEMRRLTKEAIEAGALGVSTSRNLAHRFRSGGFAPSVKTEQDELLALAGGLTDAGAGVFQVNPNLENPAAGELAIFTAVARASGRPLNFSLISTPFRTENWDIYVEGLRDAYREGLSLRGQYLPRPIGVLFGLDLSYNPFSLNPSYRDVADLPLAEKVTRLRDPNLRARLIAEEPVDPNPFFAALVKMTANLFPLGDSPNYNPSPDQSISAQARSRNIPERELIYDELLKQDGHAILYSTSSNPVQGYLDKTAPLFNQPNAIIGLGDGGAHYGMICDAAYTTYLLTQRVGKHELDLPMIIKSITSEPAASVGLNDRGRIAAGFKADLNVIDLNALRLYSPRIKTDLPGGGKRLSQKASGYLATIVSGVVTYRDGEATGALPGRLVRGARDLPVAAE